MDDQRSTRWPLGLRPAPTLAVGLAGYAVGSLPVAVLVGRGLGKDPRRHGDGNPGFWNIRELFGTRRALPVLVGDTLKGTVGGLCGKLAGGGALIHVGVLGAIIGHAAPAVLGPGGRSVLTFTGGVAVISPPTFALGWTVVLAVGSATGSFATGARAGVAAIPLLQAAIERDLHRVAGTGVLMTAVGARFFTAAAAARRSGRANSAPAAASPT